MGDLDASKLDAFLGKVVGDIGATMSAVLVVIGDRLGYWKAMGDGLPVAPPELARRTHTAERYCREWLNAQAAGGYVSYDPSDGSYTLPPAQASALADETSPAFVPGLFAIAQAMWAAGPRIEENFRSGKGLAWGEQHPCLFDGTERFFRAAYLRDLVGAWIPALDGVEARLRAGALVADVGCGLGAATIIMAGAYPRSRFFGFDSHAASIHAANHRAREAGVADRVTFQVADAADFPGANYDLVAHFDSLHDMEDPVAGAQRVRRALAPHGSWMIVEPFAGDRPEENHNPVGRVFYSASTMLCVPHSLHLGGPALGAQAGEARLRDVATSGGFSTLARVAETPFNLVLQASI